jgi:parallel beta-helix repeat protein
MALAFGMLLSLLPQPAAALTATPPPPPKITYLPIVYVNFLALDDLGPLPDIPPATPVPTPTAFPTAPPGSTLTATRRLDDGVEWVQVTGAGLDVGLPDIAAAAGGLALSHGPLLVNEGAGVWRLNTNLSIGANLTLRLTPDTVSWLKLRSDSSPLTDTIDTSSFARLYGINARILISGTKVTSWDTIASTFDTTPKNGRAFVLVEDAARMDIFNSEIAYLGSPAGGGSYGISWRDERKVADAFVAGVTGDVINNDIHHNYYGFFTYAASGMIIRRNTFRDSDSYGFDPHDFSHGFLVEDNQALNNGNHGFIISRGCHNFVFRRNKSYNNVYRVDDRPFRAHGFMIDPGGQDSQGGPYTPSYNNLLENNEAYGNQGYGLRLLDAYTTTVRNNTFRNNLRGVTIERDSFDTILTGNIIRDNGEDGIQLIDDVFRTYIVANTIINNAQEGIYFTGKAQTTTVAYNDISGGQFGIRGTSEIRLNIWTRNSIVGAAVAPIQLASNANRNMLPPYDLSVSGFSLRGKARAGATVEVYSDDGGQARFFEGRTVADAGGNWAYTTLGAWRGAKLTALAITADRGASELAVPVNR